MTLAVGGPAKAQAPITLTMGKGDMEAFGTKFIEVDLRPFMERTRAVAQELEAAGEWSHGLFDYVASLAD